MVYEKDREIWVVRGIYNIAAKVNEIIQTCQKELLLALPHVVEDIAETGAANVEGPARKRSKHNRPCI